MKLGGFVSWRDWGWSFLRAKLPFRRAATIDVENRRNIIPKEQRPSSPSLTMAPASILLRKLLGSWPSVVRGIGTAAASFFLFGSSRVSHASGGFISDSSSLALRSSMSPIQVLLIWGTLFLVSALMHAAESAITKLSVWQLQELAEADGVSVFNVLINLSRFTDFTLSKYL